MLAIDDIVEQVRSERGWSAGAAEAYRRAYIAFLSNSDGSRRPSEAVDAIWHAHILWTRRYRQDCEALVGHFVDHEPDALMPGRCTSPEQPDGMAKCAPRCTAPEEDPPPLPPLGTGLRRAANCTPSGPQDPNPGGEPVSVARATRAMGQ